MKIGIPAGCTGRIRYTPIKSAAGVYPRGDPTGYQEALRPSHNDGTTADAPCRAIYSEAST